MAWRGVEDRLIFFDAISTSWRMRGNCLNSFMSQLPYSTKPPNEDRERSSSTGKFLERYGSLTRFEEGGGVLTDYFLGLLGSWNLDIDDSGRIWTILDRMMKCSNIRPLFSFFLPIDGPPQILLGAP